MASSIDHERFIALLIERFPEVATDIDDCAQGLLHLEMATLARATQTAIVAGDEEMVKGHFRFVDELLRDADLDVRNAVCVSYLENLNFEAVRPGRPRPGSCLRRGFIEPWSS